MTARAGALLRGKRLLAVTIASALLAAAAGLGTARGTSAAFVTPSVATSTPLKADTMPVLRSAAGCSAKYGQMTTLNWDFDDPDHLITALNLTMTVTSGGSPKWQTEIGTGTVTLPATQTSATFGIANQGGPYKGTISVQAIGPGGWTSNTLTSNWVVDFGLLNTGAFATSTCDTPQSS